MNMDHIYRYFEQHYLPKREILPRIPLGADPDNLWNRIMSRRKEKAAQLPLIGPRGQPFWYVTTDKMITASETIVEELLNYDGSSARPGIAPLEEVFYTSYVEGSSMTMQEAMAFLQGDMEPGDVREQMIVNNRSALSFAGSNLFHPIDEEYIRMLAMILTQNMDGGGREYRGTDHADIPSMMSEPYEVPPASEIPDRVMEITGFLADHTVHPLIKASAAQAWVLAVRPFREGNERLARLLSNVVLVRAGYAFFGEISLSGLIARNGYPYYNAAANILRVENCGDLTYFLEYYVALLAQAVEERRRRKQKQEEENRKAEEKLARTALQPYTQPQTPQTETEEDPDESTGADLGPSPPAEDSVRETTVEDRLTADGYVSLTDVPAEVPATRWSGERAVRAELNAIIQKSGGVYMQDLAKVIMHCLDERRFIITSRDLAGMMGSGTIIIGKAIGQMLEKGILERAGVGDKCIVYHISSGKNPLTKDDYTSEMLDALNDLADHSPSSKDRRMAGAIRNCLGKGIITVQDFEGGETKWQEDMKLAEQMGFVRRISNEICLILSDARPCFDRLEPHQKKRAKQMYESFGEEKFSLEMVVATLDYSNNKASAWLHQFTLLKILDCRKEDKNLYRFLVNPREHPEVFNDAA